MSVTTEANIAIVQHEQKSTITFLGKPSIETTRQLRAAGFDFDRRSNVWFRRSSQGVHSNEGAVLSLFIE
jgi:hypothetical protein